MGLGGISEKMSVTLVMPTQVKRLPGGWWSASKLVKAMSTMKIIGRSVKSTSVVMGMESKVT